MTIEIWLMFSAAAFLNIITPGPAILLAISNGVTSGLKSVAVAALGNALGLFLISAISMFGLGLILKTSAVLFAVIKFTGAAYLIYLGVKKFRADGVVFIADNRLENGNEARYFKKFIEAFFVAITNPKAILFFIAFFPIFLNTKSPLFPQFMIMTLTFMGISFLSLLTYGYLAKSVRHWFKKATFIRVFHKLTGGIFVGFGIALLQTKS